MVGLDLLFYASASYMRYEETHTLKRVSQEDV